MGYTTDFWGEFTINKPVDDETYALLEGLNRTRRMKRDIVKLGMRKYGIENPTVQQIADWQREFGIEGEFWVYDTENSGQNVTEDVINQNTPPETQPGLWCQWYILDDRVTIAWDGGEKFYHYIEWIEYIIVTILKPRGYVVNGEVEWQGEDLSDAGMIVVKDNKVLTKQKVFFYLTDEDARRVRKIVNDYIDNGLKEVLDEVIDKEE